MHSPRVCRILRNEASRVQPPHTSHDSPQRHRNASNSSSRCHISTSGFAPRQPGAELRRRAMEIAAFVMIVSVLMGVLQQFDHNTW